MIRSIRPKDIPACVKLYNHYVENTTVSFEVDALTDADFGARVETITQRFPYLVWEDDRSGEVLGYAYLNVYSERLAYRFTCDLSIYVRREHHNIGIGHMLYRAIETLAYEQGFFSIVAIVSEENKESIKFHERQGFVRVADLDDIAFKQGRWVGVRYYRKMLRTPDRIPRELRPPVQDYCEETE